MGTFFTRQRIVGIIGIIVAVTLAWLVSTQVTLARVSTLRITYPGAAFSEAPLLAIPLPTVYTTIALALVLIAGAVYLMVRPRQGSDTIYTGALIVATIFTILIWASAGQSVDIIDMLARMVRLATPIALGAIAGILCERSGVVNIAIEGLMLMGACVGFIVAAITGNPWLGVAAAMAAGGITVLLHALLAIRFKTDQIISGTVINILAVGVTGFLRNNVILKLSPGGGPLPQLAVPGLSSIPVIGPVLFTHQPIAYAMLILVPVMSLLLFRTPWGLRTRAIGEHPRAADTVGVDVIGMRYRNVFYSGLVAGLAGAWFSIEATYNFDDLMTNGRGFIALAAMIFGKWTPWGAMGGALIFSSADALQIKIQGFSFALPAQFIQMLPYVITVVVLAGIIGRARPPAAVGQPYEK
jgi:simple sugar transport system permease protein